MIESTVLHHRGIKYRRFASWINFVPVLLCLVMGVAVVVSSRGFAGDEPAAPKTESVFSFADLQVMAEQLAVLPYAPPEKTVPDFLSALSPDQWRAIRYRPRSYKDWDDPRSPFSWRLLLPGFIFTQSVRINIVDGNGVLPVPPSSDLFETEDQALAARLKQVQVGFGGFSLAHPETAGVRDGDAVFGVMGAFHFQFRGRNARFGVDARPVSLDTATSSGEQRPFFREYWLSRSADDPGYPVVYALMDSPGMTGAFEMTAIPGTAVGLDVRATFFRRNDAAWPTKIGLAPITGMFLFSETERGSPFDYRPEVHTCDGLLIAADNAGWRWVPLKNPQRLAISSFDVDNPRGFGLVQRDVDFEHYQDLGNNYERCSSVWIEPKGDWGEGRVELVEIPNDKEYHSNIRAYWVPGERSPLRRGRGVAAEAEGAAGVDAPFTLDYRLYWMPPGTPLHEIGVVRATRIARTPAADGITFVIDFEGGALNELPADTGLTSVVEAPEEAPLLEKNLMKNDTTGGWRLMLKFRLPQGGVLERLLIARDGPTPLRFSAHLKKGENLTDALTEKWTYNLTP